MVTAPFLVPAILIGLLAIPLVLAAVPPNRVYGIRTRGALSDAGRWYAVNRLGGWCLLAASLCYLALAAVLPSPGPGSDLARWLLHLAAFVGPLAVGLVIIRRHGGIR